MNYTDFLTDLGFTDVSEYGTTVTFSTWDGMGYEIDKSSVLETDTREDIMRKSIWLSPCCGEMLEADLMICPGCGEHC